MFQSILELCANAFGNRLEPWLLEGKLSNKDEKNWIIVKEQKWDYFLIWSVLKVYFLLFFFS